MADRDMTVRWRLLGRDNLHLFGVDLREAYPLPDGKEFEDLLQALEDLEAGQEGPRAPDQQDE